MRRRREIWTACPRRKGDTFFLDVGNRHSILEGIDYWARTTMKLHLIRWLNSTSLQMGLVFLGLRPHLTLVRLKIDFLELASILWPIL